MDKKEIYFDVAATAPMTNSVQQVLMKSLGIYGNPSSLHRKGMEAEHAVVKARKQILRTLGVSTGQIIFTSGGTEADNLAIFGSANIRAAQSKHIVSTAIEHPAVIEPLRALMREGYEVTFVPPTRKGDILASDILQAIREDTVLVSMMHVNNETGAILPVNAVGEVLAKKPKILFHVDGTQAFGKIPLDFSIPLIDMYTISGHKIGGPKGIGALYVREGITLAPRILGGGQEQGARSGTENVLGAIALGEAATEARQICESESSASIGEMAMDMINHLRACGFQVERPESATPFIIRASLRGHRGEVIVHAFESEGLFVSTGSACSSKQIKANHVLDAMGVAPDEQVGSIRISFPATVTTEELTTAKQIIQRQTAWLQQIMGRHGA